MRHLETFEGRIGQVKELVEFGTDGGCVLNFTVAETPRKKVNNEWVDGVTIWTNVTLWNHEARAFVASAIKPGTIVTVIGYREASEYQDKDSGQTRTSQKINAETVAVSLTRFQTVTGISDMKSVGQSTQSPSDNMFNQSVEIKEDSTPFASQVNTQTTTEDNPFGGDDNFSLFDDSDNMFQ